VKPPAFTYHRPDTRAEVDALLADLGAEAKILAGGQSLVPILNMRLATPAHVVDINHLGDEPRVPHDVGGALACGPLVRQESLERSAQVAARVPLLAAAVRHVAHPAIRSRGTVAGSIAHADPAAELPAVLVVLDGSVVARSARGERTIAARDFFAGALESSLAPDEWVVEVRWPDAEEATAYAFEEFARRRGDYALCGVAASVTDGGETLRVALAYLGMGDVPVKLEAEVARDDARALEGAVTALVDEHLDPPADIHASTALRLHLGRRLGLRVVRRALDARAEAA
jgi:carbon-monoxide dehydrogenase medium subunit